MAKQTFLGDNSDMEELANESRITEVDDLEDSTDDDVSEENISIPDPIVKIKGSNARDGKVENAADVPLFADSNTRGIRSIAKLCVVKLDMPGAGYKGEIPLTSTLETIGQLFGDGIYNIEARNTRNQVIRSLEQQRISLGTSNAKNDQTVSKTDKTPVSEFIHVLKADKEEHKRELERVERLAKVSAEQVVEQGRQFVTLINNTTQSAAQREREHMASVNKQQSEFFASVMAQSTASFQQMFLMMTAAHQQTMEMMRASNERSSNQPMAMVEVLLKGLAMGRELEGDDTPDWIKGLTAGGDMVSNLAKIMVETKKPKETVPTRKLPNPSVVSKKEIKEPIITPVVAPKVIKKEDSDELTIEEIEAAKKLKRELLNRGMSLVESVEAYSKYTDANGIESDDTDTPNNDLENQGDIGENGPGKSTVEPSS